MRYHEGRRGRSWRRLLLEGQNSSSGFYGSPFGMTAQEANGWLHYGGGLELWRELYAPFGVVPCRW